MNVEEFKQKIAESENKVWFEEINQIFDFPYINYKIEIKGLVAIYEFLNKQIAGWQAFENSRLKFSGATIPQEVQYSKKYFADIKNDIVSLVIQSSKETGNITYFLNRKWGDVIAKVQDIRSFPLPYECPEAEFLISVYDQNAPRSFLGAFDYLVDKINPNAIKDRDYRIGTQRANNFRLKEDTKQHLLKIDDQYNEYKKELDLFKSEKDLLIEETDALRNNFQTFNTKSEEEIDNLKKTYGEKLRMEGPVEYWHERAVKLKREAWDIAMLLIILITLVCSLIYSLLQNPPAEMLASIEKEPATVIKWSIAYVTFVAFFSYGITVLSKITFSSFHLARDAEERKQLTHVYLALLQHDDGVHENERSLIMQSIFSRADTGLLKDDSSPTMPNDMLSKLLESKK